MHHWEENLYNKPGSLSIYNDGGCAAYGSIKNAKLSPNDNVVIVGAGGLALMTIRQAKAVTRAKIIAVHLDDNKLEVAKENGANSVVNSRKEDPVKTVMELTDKTSPDAVIDFVNSSKIVETNMNMLRRRVRALTVGLFGSKLKLNLVTFPTRAYRLIGSCAGTLNDFRELVSLQKVIIKPVISNRFKLDEATKALQILKDSKIIEEV